MRRCDSGDSSFTYLNISCYYPLLLVWSLIYMINSMHKDLPWYTPASEVSICAGMSEMACTLDPLCVWSDEAGACAGDVLRKASSFFRNQCNSDLDVYDEGIKNISGYAVLAVGVSWFACFLFITGGAKILGYIMYITMTLPSVFLVLLIIVGCTLEGSGKGIKAYIAKFDLKQIGSKPDAWVKAVGQGVFSYGIGQGTLAAFGAHSKREQNFVQDVVIVGIADTVFAFFAGFSVFAVVGYLATQLKLDDITNLPLAGMNLAFMSYPVGISQLGSPWSNILCVMFFMTLWFLGMDTLVGFCEAAVLMITDSRLGKRFGIKRWQATAGYCIFFFFWAGLLAATNMGVHFLEVLDHFSCNIAQVVGCTMECIAAGWIFKYSEQSREVGLAAWWSLLLTWFGGAILGTIVAYAGSQTAGIVLAVCIMIGGLVLSLFLTKKESPDGRRWSLRERAYRLYLGNIDDIRDVFNTVCCQGYRFWRVPMLWSVCIKFLVPVITVFLVISTASTHSLMYGMPDVNKDPYPGWVFFIGQFGPAMVIIGFFLALWFPDALDFLLPEGAGDINFSQMKELPPTYSTDIRDVEAHAHKEHVYEDEKQNH